MRFDRGGIGGVAHLNQDRGSRFATDIDPGAVNREVAEEKRVSRFSLAGNGGIYRILFKREVPASLRTMLQNSQFVAAGHDSDAPFCNGSVIKMNDRCESAYRGWLSEPSWGR